MTIGLERGVTPRPDMVQHENGADAGEQRPQQVMRPGQIERAEAGADDVVAEFLHGRAAWHGCDFRKVAGNR